MRLYQYPKYSTCRKATKFLNEKSIEFISIDITEQPPTTIELEAMLESYGGGIKKLFNTSGVQYRELNMKEKLPSMSVRLIDPESIFPERLGLRTQLTQLLEQVVYGRYLCQR